MQETSNKGPITHLEKHIPKYDKRTQPNNYSRQIHQLHKWLKTMIQIKYNQIIHGKPPLLQSNKKACLIKLQTGQYMNHARKQLFFCNETYPSKTCPICNLSNANTWLHVLFKCKYQHIHALLKKGTTKPLGNCKKFLFPTKNQDTKYQYLLTLIVKELNNSVEQSRMITTLNIIKN